LMGFGVRRFPRTFIVLMFLAIILGACSPGTSTADQSQPGNTTPIAISQPNPSPNKKFQDDLPLTPIRFERISIENGLSNNSVRSILQDSQGYLWFATNDGLNKYDGYSFKVYRHNSENANSLKSNRIESIYEDRSAVLWVTTDNGWLERFDREKDQFTHYELPSAARSMYEDTTGVFWVGTDYGGLLRFNRETGEYTNVWSGTGFKSIFEDREGVVWVGNRDGWLGRYDRGLDQFDKYEVGNWVEAIYEDQVGHLWLGTAGGGLVRFVRETGEIIHYRHDPEDLQSVGSDIVPTIHEDRSGTLWIGAYRGGLNQFDRDLEQFTRHQSNPADLYSLSDDLVLSVYQDRSGVLWIGTELSGLNKLSETRRNMNHFRSIPGDLNSLGNNAVTSILEDHKGMLWIGTRGGLDYFDRSDGQWRHYRHDPNDPNSLTQDYVGSIYEDEDGVIWIGTGSGLEKFDREDEHFIHYLAQVPGVYGMHQDHSRDFWVTASDGLYKFDRASDSFKLIRTSLLSAGRYWSEWILEDTTGVLWMGTSGDGLGRYDPKTDEWQLYQHNPEDPGSISDGKIEAYLEDRSGTLWIGTHRGLNRFDQETETFSNYRMKDGLPSDVIWGILEDQTGNLWLSTNQGLSKFDPVAQTFTNYDFSDGLQSNQFSRGAAYKSSSGEMFFGGVNGFNAFFPEQILDNPYPPPVVITTLSIFNKVVSTNLLPNERIELTHEDNFLSFDFAALDYNNPEQNQYAYKMVGVDEDWVYIGNRRHTDYPNLRPGNYIFKVIGSNSDGVWNRDGISVNIDIKPPFWETWWFRGILLLTLCGGAFGAYRLRIRSVEIRSKELEKQVEERTDELQQEVKQRLQAEEALRKSETEKAVAAERSRLARDLHDSVTQSIYSSTLMAEAGQRHAAGGDVEQARTTFRRLGQITQQALKEMRLLVYELRPLALEQVGLVAALQGRLDAVERRAGIDARLVVDERLMIDPDCEAALYYLAHEALNNALKHASPERVEVRIEMHEPSNCHLKIHDDGIGFDPVQAEESGGMGLVSMRERVAGLNGTFVLKSAPGEGTTITITLPMNAKREGEDQ
jgi:signal transduction histidine kinase/ligand-binding sensor domain-containing protein